MVIPMKHRHLLLFVLILIFISIATIITINPTPNFDLLILNDIYRSDNLTIIMRLLTKLGSTPVLIVVSIILFLIIKEKKISHLVPVNLLYISIINNILKITFQRPRPINPLNNASGFSFPSGHSASSLAFYGLLIYFIYSYCPNKKIKYTSIILLSFLILIIGFSRIYLRVHYPTDVLAGFSYSLAYLIIYIKLFKKDL